jgi:hypothetical protein
MTLKPEADARVHGVVWLVSLFHFQTIRDKTPDLHAHVITALARIVIMYAFIKTGMKEFHFQKAGFFLSWRVILKFLEILNPK